MPESVPIYRPIWDCVRQCIADDKIAATAEIYDELTHIRGPLGDCISEHKSELLMEVDDDSWDGPRYVREYDRMRKDHAEWIAEYSMKSAASTICLNDLTAVALAKTLGIPVVSMETRATGSPKHKRIPDICDLEDVLHYTFNDFMTIEGFGQ
jgi:hypothetical protein